MSAHLLVQVSDVHVRADGVFHETLHPLENLAAVLGAVEAALRPDALVLSGDLADDGAPASYEALAGLVGASARRLGCEVLYLPGNHDERGAFSATLLGGRRSGPLDQVLWCGGLRLVGLDSTVPGEPHGELEDAQLDWLAEVLATPAPDGTVVVLHHPPVPSPIGSMSEIALAHPERLASAIAARDVRIVLAGHNHHASASALGGVPVFVAGATSYESDPLVGATGYRGQAGSSFARIDLGAASSVATVVPVGRERLF